MQKTISHLIIWIIVGLHWPAVALPGRGPSQRFIPGVHAILFAQIPAAEDPIPEVKAEEPVTLESGEPAETKPIQEGEVGRRNHGAQGVIVKVGDVELKENESADVVVVIGGSARIAGKVSESVVAVGGNVEVSGEVGDQVVAVFGAIKALDGSRIRGDAVSVGGNIVATEGAEIQGERTPISFLNDEQIQSIKTWFFQCVIKMRPLAPQVGWVWVVAGICFLFYLLIALVFPRPIGACVEELMTRPALTFIMSVVTVILVPLIVALVAATGLGLIVVPFLLAALVLTAIAGKVAVLEWVGLRIIKSFSPATAERMSGRGGGAALGLVLGAIVVAILYMIPFLGLTMFLVLSVWGFGSAVMATFGSFRKELPARPAPVEAPSPPFSEAGPSAPGSNPSYAFTSLGGPAAQTAPPLIEDHQLPKATFWERVAAGVLDLILVGFLNAAVNGPPWGFVLALAYFAGMWTWKRTTVGGIVCNLRIVRVDGRPVNFAVALVRALGGAFSMCIFFLGFLWIAWDRDRQGWHDKLAGTLVLRQPRPTPLV